MSAKSVYIIDDDPIYQFSFKSFLSLIDADIKIEIFSNGEEAYEHCKALVASKSDCPDIVFLDLNMPVMDGWNYLDEMMQLEYEKMQDVSIYIVSSSVHEEDMEKAKHYSLVKDYLVKPVDRAKIEEVLKR